MSILIESSVGEHSTNYSFQRKLVKSTVGKLVLFANVNNVIQYKTSTDDGDTWSSWISVFSVATTVHSFDVYIDTNNDIYLAFYVIYFNARLYFKKLTYSGGNWSLGSNILIDAGVNRQYPTITKATNGDLWVSANDTSSSFIHSYYSDDIGATWNGGGNWSSSSTFGCAIIPHGNNLWIILQRSGHLEYHESSSGSTWNDLGDIVASGITNGAQSLGVVKISDNDIWVAGSTSSGLKVFHWNGSVWDSGTLISDQANDRYPSLSNINGQPLIVWSDWNGSTYDMAYRLYNGASWDSQVNVTSDATKDFKSSSIDNDTGTLYLTWTRGSSPYDLYFHKVAFTFTVLSDIINDFRLISNITRIDTNNDFRLTGVSLENIINDFRLIGNISEIDVNNNFISRLETLSDIDNKFNTVKLELEDIDNKFNTVIEVKSDVENTFNLVNENISDISNDVRTHKIEINNVSNDFRMIAPWQIPGEAGVQSLGKTYIKVYINSVEQTDADINSISITKILNDTHTASFELGRAYDSTKPAMEAMVEIKYHIWTIYKGYIIDISPTDSPESIRIACNDKYWKQNKTNKYFFVGHKPQDDKEKYYNTPQEALVSELGFTIDFGSFIPQTLDCFGLGESNCISSLIQESGNFSWFYKEDESKKIWRAGQGDIINIEAQSIGTNLSLYQILAHRFRETVEGLVNKFRVQMGEKIIRKFSTTGGTKSYSGYTSRYFRAFAQPAWDKSDETLAKNSSSGYGWDYHDTLDDDRFSEVFRKFYIPSLNSDLEAYSDRYPPKIKLYGRGSAPYGWHEKVVTEGFTIDYENKLIIFNEPQYSLIVYSDGEIKHVYRKNVELLLTKTLYYSHTVSPSEDPETDESNPMLFFTDKMGTYSDTILGLLDLSSLSIQEGGTYLDSDENEVLIPSWNDIDFAKDIANWKLSALADKKVEGSVDITLDAFLFYDIDLSKRIMINNVLDNPLNINSITINISNFMVTLNLESYREYKRTVNLQSHGE